MHCKALNNRTIDYPYPKDFRPDWCPLKKVPEKDEENYCLDKYMDGYSEGWNTGIAEMLE